MKGLDEGNILIGKKACIKRNGRYLTYGALGLQLMHQERTARTWQCMASVRKRRDAIVLHNHDLVKSKHRWLHLLPPIADSEYYMSSIKDKE